MITTGWRTGFGQLPLAGTAGYLPLVCAQAGTAAVMRLIQSAQLNGHDAYVFLKNILERFPTQPASRTMKLCPIAGKLRPNFNKLFIVQSSIWES